MCVAFCVVAKVPSPNVHHHDDALPPYTDVLSVKRVGIFIIIGCGATEKLATGKGSVLTTAITVSEIQPLLVAVIV